MKTFFLHTLIFIFSTSVLGQVAPGLCWKISGGDLKKDAYIMGTMHVSNPQLKIWPKAVEKAFKKSKMVVTELDMNQTPNVLTLMKMFEMPDNRVLNDLISDEFFADLELYFTDSVGTDLSIFSKFPPILIIGIINKEGLFPTNNGDGDALDVWLFKRAEKMGKKVGGIETFEEQIKIFHAVSPDTQAVWLYNAFYKPESFALKTSLNEETLLEYYLSANLEAMQQAYVQSKNESAFLSAADHYFMHVRNHNMYSRSLALFKEKKGVFLAVGALHLVGPDGLLSLYQKAGYKVEMVK